MEGLGGPVVSSRREGSTEAGGGFTGAEFLWEQRLRGLGQDFEPPQAVEPRGLRTQPRLQALGGPCGI